jgi:DNA replication and repair protein RecF
MHLQQISILNYKNIEQAGIDFSEKLNFFVGANGMGKTNIIDAIYYLSFCRSHNQPNDAHTIRHDADHCLLQATYLHQGQHDEYLLSMKRHGKKILKKNKKEYEKFSDHIADLPLVLVSPDDQILLSGGGEERRRWLDLVVSQFDRLYLQSLIAYNHALKQRNAVLRSETAPDTSLLDILEEQLATHGDYIYRRRRRFVDDLAERFQRYYRLVSGDAEQVSMEYRSQLQDTDFLQLLAAKRSDDFRLGYTSTGIHRDDLDMWLCSYPVRRTGSQGQKKSFCIALRFAQFDYLQQSSGKTPLILLDDIFDKLDRQRVLNIISLVSGSEFDQIFISDTSLDRVSEALSLIGGEYRIFEINRGKVTPAAL